VSRIPSLGPRGEGWVALQVAAIWLVIATVNLGRLEVADPGVRGLVVGIGWLLFALGGVLLIAASLTLRAARAFTVLPQPRAGGELVESGPFRLIRHPVYAGLIAGSLGVALSRLAPGTLVATAILFVILDLKRRREEVWLLQRFPGYEAYQARTKALIPFLY